MVAKPLDGCHGDRSAIQARRPSASARSCDWRAFSDSSLTIEFNAIEGYQPPSWPDEHGGKRFHLELMVDSLDDAAATLIAAGAAQPEFQPGGNRFRVLTDPAGHPFCIIDRAVAEAD